jgi:hypothetical protein
MPKKTCKLFVVDIFALLTEKVKRRFLKNRILAKAQFPCFCHYKKQYPKPALSAVISLKKPKRNIPSS